MGLVLGLAGILFGLLVLFLSLFLGLKFFGKYHAYSLPILPTESLETIYKKTVSFLQYNVFWRPGLLHIGREEYVKDRSDSLPSFLERFDIVSLNEAFQYGSSNVHEFVKKLKAFGFKYFIASDAVSMGSFKLIDSGLLMCSKFPIIETDSIVYADGIGFDAFSAKGALYAKIQCDKNDYIHVFSTHLQASYGDPTGEDVIVRINQIKQLKEFMQHKVIDRRPIALLGDFNVNGRKDVVEYANLYELLRIDGYKITNSVDCSMGGFPITYGDIKQKSPLDQILTVKEDWGTEQCLDYIFLYVHADEVPIVSEHVSRVEPFYVTGKPYSQLSDHYGVSCKLVFK